MLRIGVFRVYILGSPLGKLPFRVSGVRVWAPESGGGLISTIPGYMAPISTQGLARIHSFARFLVAT